MPTPSFIPLVARPNAIYQENGLRRAVKMFGRFVSAVRWKNPQGAPSFADSEEAVVDALLQEAREYIASSECKTQENPELRHYGAQGLDYFEDWYSCHKLGLGQQTIVSTRDLSAIFDALEFIAAEPYVRSQ